MGAATKHNYINIIKKLQNLSKNQNKMFPQLKFMQFLLNYFQHWE